MQTILLIDDDATLRQVLEDLLQSEGFHTLTREGGSDIQQVILENKPNVIILDYFLPGENGATIALRLKNNQQTKNIPIIMISSHYGIENLVKQTGIDAFLPKPFDIDHLVSLIHSLAP